MVDRNALRLSSVLFIFGLILTIGAGVLHPGHEDPNVLFYALNIHTGLSGWLNRLATISTGVTLAMYAVLQAVDGVVLKRAVVAWVNAPAAEKPRVLPAPKWSAGWRKGPAATTIF